MKKTTLQFKNTFLNQGWYVLSLLEPNPVVDIRNHLIDELRNVSGFSKITLENYHEYFDANEKHTDIQFHMTQFFRAHQFGRRIIESQKDFFVRIMGPDLKVQRNPYLRITRPNKTEDNIGFHRDTFYGGSPFELSVVVPFVNTSLENSLAVLSGSHILDEKHFPTTRVTNSDSSITKGSLKHQLGFLYAPKVLDENLTANATPIPLKLGEALMFSLSTLHGSTLNSSQTCRWSSDIRVVNALAPVDLSLRPDYYEVLESSAITSSAEAYFKAQQPDRIHNDFSAEDAR